MFNAKTNRLFCLYLSILACNISLYAGFAAGTLVKTPKGYQPIESLQIGDFVYSVTPQRTYNISKVTHTTSYAQPTAIKMVTENDIIIAAPRQKFYLPHEQKWISAKKIKCDNHLGTSQKTCAKEFTIYSQTKLTDFFDIRLDNLHTFCVSTDDIIVHNFPLCFLGFTIAWGAGKIALDGIYCGICIAGWWLGTKLLKGTKVNNNNFRFTITPSTPNHAPDPDDEEWKQKHPHGKHIESPKHHPNARNSIGKPPRDGQAALDNSFEVLGKKYRIAMQDGNIIQLVRTTAKEYHGFIVEEWLTLDKAAQKTLQNHGYNFHPKTGKLKV
ncbi:hypothetical protein KBD08_03340 [Candidatus Babeliales bacterium]|nr:hypothetical protein [Candidatus Babeliales bacterium]